MYRKRVLSLLREKFLLALFCINLQVNISVCTAVGAGGMYMIVCAWVNYCLLTPLFKRKLRVNDRSFKNTNNECLCMHMLFAGRKDMNVFRNL